MREDVAGWEHGVVLVCTNERAPGAAKPSCGKVCGATLRGWLKAELRAGGGPAAKARVLSSSCLDLCPPDGSAVALMPGNRMVVVDPEGDRDALLALVQEHFAAVAEGDQKKGRVLSRIKDRLR